MDNENDRTNIDFEQDLDLNIVDTDSDDLILDNGFEEDVLSHMPKIREMIYLGRDTSDTFALLAREIGVSPNRFKKLYNAVKKEQHIQTEIRSGRDMRAQLLHEADAEIAKLKQERKSFLADHDAAIVQAKNLEKEEKDIPIWLLAKISLKKSEYYKILNQYDTLIVKLQERKAKLAGVEVARKEIINVEAHNLIRELYDISEARAKEHEQKRSANQIYQAPFEVIDD